ncbi:MAG: dihydroxy-acid dehydratase [Lachnospiraceae bacterium]|nr:dihydroxy-acid dehydratase [Lachnospiraceae bacterium]
MKKKYEDMRSCWEFSEASECRRGLMCGMGYTNEEQKRPLIGIVNSWNEYNPGHVHLDKLAERVKQGVREAGGLPLEVETTGICDGMVLKDPRYIEVPSRNSIADQVELTVEGNFFDGMVMLCTCDSIVPGHLMGAARLDIPTILVTGGYMPLGVCRGEERLHIRAQDKVGQMAEGTIDPDLYNDLIEHSWGTCGACTSMVTANSMCMMAEAMGMTLPNNSTMQADGSEIYNLAYRAGKHIMDLVFNGITARQIMTREAIKNAIKVDMAVAASSNLILHLPAIAHEAGYDDILWWKEFDKASNEIPLLSHLAPGGEYTLKDLDLAGGLQALMNKMRSTMDTSCLTVNGKTLGENLDRAVCWNDDVIRGLDNPVSTQPGIGVLYGNLCPEGSIIKIAAVPQKLMKFRGPAKCFDTLDDALDALRNGRIVEGDACVVRFLGLKARFGTTAFTFQEELKGYKGLFESCAVITDGRFSGGTSGLSVGYVSPEAAFGPLGLVKDGDMIDIDVVGRSINMEVSDEELEERKKNFHWEFDADSYPRFLRLFVKNVGPMSKGGIWE